MKINIRLKLIYIFGFISLLFLSPFLVKTSRAAGSWNITQITSGDVSPSSLRLQSGNNGFGLVWVDSRPDFANIYFTPIKILGNRFIRVDKEIKLTYDGRDETPSLVWNGQDYALFWSHERSQIYFARFNESGRKIIENKSLNVKSKGYAIHISAVWNGQEYGVTWWDVRDAPSCNPPGTRGRAFFARVNNNGEMIGEEIPIPNAFSNPWQDYYPQIVWDGENYAIFWGDSRENGECAGGVGDIYMAKVNRNGEKILGDIKLQSNELSPQLWDVEWDGENYVIGYNGRIAQGHLGKMNTNGNTVMADIPINSGNQGGSPTITSHNDKYYIAWGDFRDRTAETFYNTEIYYTETDKDGNKIIPETRITFYDQPSTEQTPIMFYKGNMGIAWIDSKDGSPQVYFASNLVNYPKPSKPQKPPKPSISITRPFRPLR